LTVFKYLEAVWTFTCLDDGSCMVELDISFEFKSYFYAYIANLFFLESAKGIIPAFELRCSYLYGDDEKIKSKGLRLGI